MKVYILLYSGIDYDKILGIFDNFEMAENSREQLVKWYHPSDMSIEEWNMNECRG